MEVERTGSLTVDARYSALDQLPPDFLRTIKFDVSALNLWTLERRRRMARSLDRHPGLTEVQIRGYTRPKQGR